MFSRALCSGVLCSCHTVLSCLCFSVSCLFNDAVVSLTVTCLMGGWRIAVKLTVVRKGLIACSPIESPAPPDSARTVKFPFVDQLFSPFFPPHKMWYCGVLPNCPNTLQFWLQSVNPKGHFVYVRLESSSLHVGSLFYVTTVLFIASITPFFRHPTHTHAAEYCLEVTNHSFPVQ